MKVERPYDEARLVDLIVSHQKRWQQVDSRLPRVPVSDIPSFLEQAVKISHHKPIVISSKNRAYSMAFSHLHKLTDDSDELVYFESLSGTAIQVAFFDTSSRTLDRAFLPLLTRLENSWRANGATAGLIHWPTRDGEVEERFRRAGYTLDSHVAFRSSTSSPGSTSITDFEINARPATRADEAAILELQWQLIQAHIPNAPFARPASTAIPGMRDRLRRTWAGEPIGRGASLVFVAEFNNRIVAMAECQIRTVTAQPGELFQPGKYVLVNSFAVSKGLRRRGIGRLFEQAISAACSELSVDGFYLIFSPYNPSASMFWPSVGYDPIWTLYQKRGISSLITPQNCFRRPDNYVVVKPGTTLASSACVSAPCHNIQ